MLVMEATLQQFSNDARRVVVLALKLATVFFRNGSHDQQQSEQNESGS
jgi:hypothetical protein